MSEHGGHTNAYTSNESTNYHFDVNWEALEPALDRSPLLPPSAPRPHVCRCALLCPQLLAAARPPRLPRRGLTRGRAAWQVACTIPTCAHGVWPHAVAMPPPPRRFAQFFICPLISPDGVDREAKAVDSE